ncbi:MAG TPA: type IA DNA topoisomerase, partial [Deltaproteobacteria bacterium]|nr:type IA DNA topoisomerase [Deltaproteobacteria bacterium]
VLKLLVDRHLERKNFKPEEYYIVKALFEGQKGTVLAFLTTQKQGASDEKGQAENEQDSKRLKKEEAYKIVEFIQGKTGVVTKVEKRLKKEPPPLLHSLTSLQREANQLYGFSAQKTLNIAQKLYEVRKSLSYPRSDAQHLDETPQTKELVKKVLTQLGYKDLISAVSKVGKRVFDNSKLTDHYALIPLKCLPDEATEDEKKIYNLVKRRFIGVFMPWHIYESTTVLIEVEDYLFKATGKCIVEIGWKALYGEQKDKILPELTEGEKLKVKQAEAEQKVTQPPPQHTEASILKTMEKLNLGTPATRAAILETLIKHGYAERRKKAFTPTPKGIELIKHVSDKEFASPEMTARWEKKLSEIRAEKETYLSFIDEIKNFVAAQLKDIRQLKIDSSTSRRILGKCSCGGDIEALNKVYRCTKCGKYVFKTVFGKRLTEKQALSLLTGKKVKLSGLKSKNGKRFSGQVQLEKQGNKWQTSLKISNQRITKGK